MPTLRLPSDVDLHALVDTPTGRSFTPSCATIVRVAGSGRRHRRRPALHPPSWRQQPQIRLQCVIADAEHATGFALVALTAFENQPRVAAGPDPKRVVAVRATAECAAA